ncbi:MAG: spermidine synthase, partial [Novosphingobium sp.]
YGLLIVLIALAARARWRAGPVEAAAVSTTDDGAGEEHIGAKLIIHWLLLSAVPSGLLLSTTSHLTTDLVAMPLLWGIPLGLYLLSFVAAFSDKREIANAVTMSAPLIMLLVGGTSMISRSTGTIMPAVASAVLLYVVAVALHARMYELRPSPSKLTLFYLTMSAGGALGGLFTALIAPLVFDWIWEHPILVLAAAALMPLPQLIKWQNLRGLDPELARIAAFVLIGLAALLAYWLTPYDIVEGPSWQRDGLTFAIALIGMLLVRWRAMYLAVLVMLMLARGGVDTIGTSLDGARTRSYFGIYTVRDYPDTNLRSLAHGTTLHGWQSLDPARSREPLTYYGPESGAGLGLSQAQALYGEHARIGVVGLGTGSLACYRKPGEDFRFFEIDPAVLNLSRNGTFTFVKQCAPDAKVVIGDARIELAQMPHGSLDVLAIDAFSSDAIPLHLLTDEAVGVYLDALGPRGLLLVHISNRFIELEPVLVAIAAKRGLAVAKRDDNPPENTNLTASTWVAFSREPAVIETLRKARPDAPWDKLVAPKPRLWTDDHASITCCVRWKFLLNRPS